MIQGNPVVGAHRERPEAYGSDNNRLQYYEARDTSGEGAVLTATTWYVYEKTDLSHDGPQRPPDADHHG
ncbi:MAG: hypothetical protein HS102_02455 [Planctomycetia bacterium]|nr:hypothetical protein [Planctomycetia bacterium]